MKISFQVEIDSASQKIFFPEERIKDKYKILEILLEACRYIIYNKKERKVQGNYKIILNKGKMSRLFFVSESKIYSIAFPFYIFYNESDVMISYKNLIDIDSFTISNLLSIIKSPALNSEDCLDFVDPVVGLEHDQKINYWGILRDLILLEDGYIRYDIDEEGYKQALRQRQQHKHPLNHFDIFYTNQVTFKLGLEEEYFDSDLIDTLDTNTNCRYLKSTKP
jgi:hypothetical protein